MKENIFWSNPYIKNFDAIIEKIDGTKIILDETAFYPMAGGQPSDRGVLFIEDEKYEVFSVQKENGEIYHELRQDILSNVREGMVVRGEIDWNWRYGLMKAHTSQHLFSSYIQIHFGCKTIDLTLTPHNVSIHLDGKITKQQLNEVISHVLEVTTMINHETHSYVLEREEAIKKFKNKLRGKLSKENPIRILEIEGLDLMCCGGTHVLNTIEIGPVCLLDFKKGNYLRFSFGENAIKKLSSTMIFKSNVIKMLESNESDTLSLLCKRLKDLDKISMKSQVLEQQFLSILAQSKGKMINETQFFMIPFGLDKKLANKMIDDFPDNSTLISIESSRFLILSNSSKNNAKKLLDILKKEFHAKGSGSPRMAQGISDEFTDEKPEDIVNKILIQVSKS